jgi:hypothetical protein
MSTDPLHPSILSSFNPETSDSLVDLNDPDFMANEQTWPTEEEMNSAPAAASSTSDGLMGPPALPSSKTTKRVPKGTSAYQAEWMIEEDGDDEDGSDEDDDSVMGEGGMEADSGLEAADGVQGLEGLDGRDEGETDAEGTEEIELESRTGKSERFEDMDQEEEDEQFVLSSLPFSSFARVHRHAAADRFPSPPFHLFCLLLPSLKARRIPPLSSIRRPNRPRLPRRSRHPETHPCRHPIPALPRPQVVPNLALGPIREPPRRLRQDLWLRGLRQDGEEGHEGGEGARRRREFALPVHLLRSFQRMPSRPKLEDVRSDARSFPFHLCVDFRLALASESTSRTSPKPSTRSRTR